MKRVLALLAIVGLALTAPTQAHALIINHASANNASDTTNPRDGIADFSNGTFLRVNNGSAVENRSIFEWDISSIVGPINSAVFEFNTSSSNGAFPFTLDFYAYTGDGFAGQNDFGLGSLFASYNYNGESQFTIDATAPIINFVGINANYAGVVVRKTPVSQFSGGPDVLFGEPDIAPFQRLLINENTQTGAAPVPEPASMLLFGTGLVGAAIRKRFNV